MDSQHKTFLETFFVLARRVVYFVLAFLSTFSFMRPKIVVLCYHSIGDDSWWFTVSLKALQEQMVYMLRYYEPISLRDLVLYLEGKKNIEKPSFIVTFDDGYQDILQTKEFFSNHHIRPTVFLLVDTEHANYSELENKRAFLQKDEVSSLREAGWEIGNHSATHADFSQLDDAGVFSEVVQSKQKLEETLLMPISYIAYPKGNYTDAVLTAVAQSGYTLGLSMNDSFISKRVNRYLIPRVGINGTHTLTEFIGTISVPAVLMRACVKTLVSGKKGIVSVR